MSGQRAFFACFFNDGTDAFAIDSLDHFGRYFQRNPLVFFRYKELFCLKIRVKPAFGLVIGVRHIIAYAWSFARNFTNPCRKQGIIQTAGPSFLQKLITLDLACYQKLWQGRGALEARSGCPLQVLALHTSPAAVGFPLPSLPRVIIS